MATKQKLKKTLHGVTNYSMPIPGIWHYTLRCYLCNDKKQDCGATLPRNGHSKRICQCVNK